MKNIPDAAPRSRLSLDVYPDRVEFNNLDGNRRRIECVTYEADEHAAKIIYNGGRSFIRLHDDHACYRFVAAAAGLLDADEKAFSEARFATYAAHTVRDDAKYLVVIPHDQKRRKTAEKSIRNLNEDIDGLLTFMRFTKHIPGNLAEAVSAIREAVDAMNAAKIGPSSAKRFAKVAAWLEAQRPSTIPAAEPSPLTWNEFAALIPEPAPLTWAEFAAILAA